MPVLGTVKHPLAGPSRERALPCLGTQAAAVVTLCAKGLFACVLFMTYVNAHPPAVQCFEISTATFYEAVDTLWAEKGQFTTYLWP